MCFDFLYKFVSNISHSKKNRERCYNKCILVFMYTTHFYCQILMKLEFSRQLFAKYSSFNFRENPSSGRRADGRTGRHDETNRRCPQFCEPPSSLYMPSFCGQFRLYLITSDTLFRFFTSCKLCFRYIAL